MPNALSHRTTRHVVAAFTLPFVVFACGGAGAPDEPERLDSEALQLSLSPIPNGFSVVQEGADRIDFVATPPELEDAAESTVVLHVGEVSEFGIELPGFVEAHRDDINAREGGDYAGGNKLVGPLGIFYYSRGHYAEGEEMLEEIEMYALHPTENRLVTVTSVHTAADDTKERLNHLLVLMGNLGPYEPPSADAAEEPAGS